MCGFRGAGVSILISVSGGRRGNIVVTQTQARLQDAETRPLLATLLSNTQQPSPSSLALSSLALLPSPPILAHVPVVPTIGAPPITGGEGSFAGPG